MSGYRMKFFENFPLGNAAANKQTTNGVLMIHAAYFPGSISFNSINILQSFAGAIVATKLNTYQIGLYSLNGGSLSLANSASTTVSTAALSAAWVSLSISTTQDITPGIWYLGFLSSSGGDSRAIIAMNSIGASIEDGAVGGPFFRGRFSATTAALPTSMATSALSKEGSSTVAADYLHPYIVITA